jgi:hypothetical protein
MLKAQHAAHAHGRLVFRMQRPGRCLQRQDHANAQRELVCDLTRPSGRLSSWPPSVSRMLCTGAAEAAEGAPTAERAVSHARSSLHSASTPALCA